MIRIFKLLLILLLVSPIFALIDLKCNYYEYISEDYGCQIFETHIMTNESINYIGQHKPNKTDEDVTMMAIYESTVNYIPDNLFSKFPNLRKFFCDSCRFFEFRSDSFKGAGNLEFLFATLGLTDILENDLFVHTPKLKSINLAGHDFKVVEDDAFRGLFELTDLNLSHNGITNLTKNIFRDLKKLTHIDLASNRIQFIDPDVFENNLELEEIDLHYTDSKLVDALNIKHLKKLKKIFH